MRRSAVVAIVGACAAFVGLGSWWLVNWAPWNPVQDGNLKPSIDSFQGYQFAAPPMPQSGMVQPNLLQRDTTSTESVTNAQITELWQPVQAAANEGKWRAWGLVVDAETGQELFSTAADIPHTPASTMKTLTGLVALEQLDPTATLQTGTSVVGTDVYLWGQGDLLMAEGTGSPTSINGRAGLADLAAATADQLVEQGHTVISLKYQDTLFQGDKRLAAWGPQEVMDYAGDLGPYAIDAGRKTTDGWSFVDDSAQQVAEVFADRLREEGVEVKAVSVGTVPAEATELATVSSATINEQLGFMLQTSDNTVAEQLCHLAAAAIGTDTTFAGATANVQATLAELGIDTTGMKLEDCSGLSENSQVTAQQLVGVLQESLSHGGQAHNLIRLFPRGGISGTLTDRLYEDSTLGNVQAKTGALGKVSALSGMLTTASGQTLLFAIGTDDVPDGAAYWTRVPLDEFVAGLAAK